MLKRGSKRSRVFPRSQSAESLAGCALAAKGDAKLILGGFSQGRPLVMKL